MCTPIFHFIRGMVVKREVTLPSLKGRRRSGHGRELPEHKKSVPLMKKGN